MDPPSPNPPSGAVGTTTSSSSHIEPVEVTRQQVTLKCDYLVDVQLWPLRRKLDPLAWLGNFQNAELDHAVHLLNAFLYFCQPLMDQLLRSAFQGLSKLVTNPGDPFLTTQGTWRMFADTVLVSRVTGERPNDADSGFRFVRMARQTLGIPEQSIVSPEEALERLLGGRAHDLVFLDDFVGSGQQFLATWRRPYAPAGRTPVSFELIAPVLRRTRYFYCPLICTEYGYARLRSGCPAVTVAAAHLLSSRYSALDPESLLWPPRLRPTARRFIETASERAGIPRARRLGFHDLALAVAFEHSVPDATLPIIYWNTNGWRPLIERT